MHTGANGASPISRAAAAAVGAGDWVIDLAAVALGQNQRVASAVGDLLDAVATVNHQDALLLGFDEGVRRVPKAAGHGAVVVFLGQCAFGSGDSHIVRFAVGIFSRRRRNCRRLRVLQRIDRTQSIGRALKHADRRLEPAIHHARGISLSRSFPTVQRVRRIDRLGAVGRVR